MQYHTFDQFIRVFASRIQINVNEIMLFNISFTKIIKNFMCRGVAYNIELLSLPAFEQYLDDVISYYMNMKKKKIKQY